MVNLLHRRELLLLECVLQCRDLLLEDLYSVRKFGYRLRDG